MKLVDYEKQFQKLEKDVDIIFTQVLSTFDKNYITNFIREVQFFQDKISKNIQILKTTQIENRKKSVKKDLKVDIYEYWIYITQIKIDLLESSIFSVIEGGNNKSIINNNKQR